MQIQKPSVMLPQDFGAVLLLEDISGGGAFHSKSLFCVEEYSLTGGRPISASILLNVNMPLRDACMFHLPSGIVYNFLTFTFLVVCHRAPSLFSDY